MFSRSVLFGGMWFALAFWSLSHLKDWDFVVPVQLPSVAHPPSPQPALKCELAGSPINRFVAEIQARGALSEGPFDKTPFTIFSMTQVEEGFLVSLGPAPQGGGITLGGGGLVWVDGESGCISVLRLYQ